MVLALLLAVLLAAGFGQWWLLPRLNDHRATLAAAVGDYLHVPTHIEAVAAERDGWRLALRLRGVSLRDPQNAAALVRFERATASFDLWRSLRERRPMFGHLRLEGVNLTLDQGEDGMPRLRADAGAANAMAPLPEVARWLFEVGKLDLLGDRLSVRLRNGETWLLLHPYFQARETDTGHQLAFGAELPPELGGRLQLRVDRARGQPEEWRGTFEARLDRFSLNRLPWPAEFASGQVAATLRGDWRDWRPVRVEGQAQLWEGMLAQPRRFAGLQRWLTAYPESELTLAGEWRKTGWRWRGQARFGDDQGRARLQPVFELHQNAERWQANIRDLRAQDLMAWLLPWLDEPARRWLAPLDPQGQLPEIAIQVEPAAGSYAVAAKLRDVAFQPGHGLPGFDKLNGTVEFRPEQGRVALDGRKVRVNTAGLLRAPITLDVLTGAVGWAQEGAGLRLESSGLQASNADLNASVWGQVIVPVAGTPLLDLRYRYRDVQASTAQRYLPVSVIPPPGVAWLDRALVGGRVVTGEGVLRGPAQAFPFDRGEGLFETHFQVEDATLDYAPGWPRLEAARGEVRFRNRGLRVEIAAARVLDAQVEEASARIDDLDEVVVEVAGRARGPGASLWRALRESPIRGDLGDNLPDVRIDGLTALNLELAIPVDARPARARGQVALLDNRVALPAWNLALERLRGEVRFTEVGFEARELQTRLRGEPIRLDLDVVGAEGRRDLRARLRGQWAPRALLDGAGAKALAAAVSGQSAWQAVLMMPTRRVQGDAPPFTLDLQSNLRGVAVRLPAPLGKTASQSRPLRIGLRPQADDALAVQLDYGEEARAALELTEVTREPRLARGEIRVNAGPAKLPEAAGLNIVARLPRWELPALQRPSDNAAESWRAVRRLDARIGELAVGRQTVAGISLSALRQDDGWRIDLDGETLAGRVTLPDQPLPRRPINAALQRLHLRRAAEPTGRDAPPADADDPRQLPPLVLTVTDLRWDGAELGRLRLVAMPQPGGLRLDALTLDSPRQHIDASGDWRWNGGEPRSRLRAAARSPALGEALAAFGFSQTGIAGGETEAELAVEWAGALPDLAMDRLEGTLKLQVGPGQLLDVNPGMGRILGLFNLQTLLRRFTLDFSDLFQPGMSFDRITGQFAFQRGQARTEDLTVEAPAARIQIEGATDLKARVYDQRITVAPKFGGALPVAGALAGGPAVGAAVFVAERLLQKGIERATRYQYRLKGSWDRPVVEPLREPAPTAEAKGFASDN